MLRYYSYDTGIDIFLSILLPIPILFCPDICFFNFLLCRSLRCHGFLLNGKLQFTFRSQLRQFFLRLLVSSTKLLKVTCKANFPVILYFLLLYVSTPVQCQYWYFYGITRTLGRGRRAFHRHFFTRESFRRHLIDETPRELRDSIISKVNVTTAYGSSQTRVARLISDSGVSSNCCLVCVPRETELK